MSRRIWIACVSGLLTCYAPQVLANNFNYNFFEFRSAASPSSLGVEFNTLAMENLHFVGRADKQFNSAFDLAGGAGFNGPLNGFVDLTGEILLHYAKGDKDSFGYDSEGLLLELNIGARTWITDTLEVHGKLGNIEDHSVVEAGFRFHSTDQLSVGGMIRNNGLWGPQTTIEVRFNF